MKSADAQLLQLDQQLCFPIYAASNLLGRLYRPQLEALGLTYPQYLVMLVLWEAGTQSVGELGGKLFLDSGTLTPVLKRLETAGWVRRERSKKDERRVEVSLTDAGKGLKQSVINVPQALFCLIGLEPESLVRLRGDMKKLVAALDLAVSPEKGVSP